MLKGVSNERISQRIVFYLWTVVWEDDWQVMMMRAHQPPVICFKGGGVLREIFESGVAVKAFQKVLYNLFLNVKWEKNEMKLYRKGL